MYIICKIQAEIYQKMTKRINSNKTKTTPEFTSAGSWEDISRHNVTVTDIFEALQMKKLVEKREANLIDHIVKQKTRSENISQLEIQEDQCLFRTKNSGKKSRHFLYRLNLGMSHRRTLQGFWSAIMEIMLSRKDDYCSL